MDRPLQEWRWLELWPLALIAIVIASWALYHFLAPRSWRDWAGAGAVQAFIIALYAEMYGFPLTIYVLTSFLHVPIPLVHGSGHLWATLLGYGSAGALVEMILGYAFVVAGLVLLTKGWRAIVHARGRLITDGIYARVRHPQYSGLFLAILGEVVHWPTLPTLLLTPVIVWLYLRLAWREEERLLHAFGQRYQDYRQRVPAFMPVLRRR